jgi:hypothetical protein
MSTVIMCSKYAEKNVTMEGNAAETLDARVAFVLTASVVNVR